jgi:hypothetical protein
MVSKLCVSCIICTMCMKLTRRRGIIYIYIYIYIYIHIYIYTHTYIHIYTRENRKVRFPVFFYVNGGKQRQKKHTDIFGYQSSVFLHRFQTCSGTYHYLRRYFPSPGGIRSRPAPEAISGPHPTHRTAPTPPPPWTSTCLENWKNISEASDFHLTTPSKPKSGSHCWTSAPNGLLATVLKPNFYAF